MTKQRDPETGQHSLFFQVLSLVLYDCMNMGQYVCACVRTYVRVWYSQSVNSVIRETLQLKIKPKDFQTIM